MIWYFFVIPITEEALENHDRAPARIGASARLAHCDLDLWLWEGGATEPLACASTKPFDAGVVTTPRFQAMREQEVAFMGDSKAGEVKGEVEMHSQGFRVAAAPTASVPVKRLPFLNEEPNLNKHQQTAVPTATEHAGTAQHHSILHQ